MRYGIQNGGDARRILLAMWLWVVIHGLLCVKKHDIASCTTSIGTHHNAFQIILLME
jgi:hypothetical protein